MTKKNRKGQNSAFKSGSANKNTSLGRYSGYDRYVRGPFGEQSVRAVLRKNRWPAGTDPDLVEHLPYELFYPIYDPPGMNLMIDMIYALDIEGLNKLLFEFPGQVFGFETFLQWAQTFYEKIHKFNHKTFTKLPLAEEPSNRDQISSQSWHGAIMDFNILHFKNDCPPVGELIIRKNRSMLSRVLIDLVTNEAEISHHFPGKWRGLGMDPNLLKIILGDPKLKLKHTTPENTLRVKTKINATGPVPLR